MSLQEKIEEIRQKPEHIRLRYVWGCVAVSMIVIITLWIFSIQTSLKNAPEQQPSEPSSFEFINNPSGKNTGETPGSTTEQAPSLNDWIQSSK